MDERPLFYQGVKEFREGVLPTTTQLEVVVVWWVVLRWRLWWCVFGGVCWRRCFCGGWFGVLFWARLCAVFRLLLGACVLVLFWCFVFVLSSCE